MKTLKDKTQYWYDDEAVEDLKQAIKDLKEELENNKINKRKTNNQIINKIMGEWEE